jgi:hypothetical protein
VGYGRDVYSVFWVGEKLNERENLEEQCVDVRLMLKSILKKYDGRAWIGLIRLRVGQVAGSCERGGEALGSIK